MFSIIRAAFAVVRVLLRERRDLAIENLALRQQLALYERQRKRPKLQARDRVFWTILSRPGVLAPSVQFHTVSVGDIVFPRSYGRSTATRSALRHRS